MISIQYIGKKPYTITYRDVVHHLTPGQVLTIPKKAARKIKGSKFRRLFELVRVGPTLEESVRDLEAQLEQARTVIINLRNRVITLEGYHP